MTVFLNPSSGSKELSAEDLAERFPGHEIVEVSPGQLDQCLTEEMARRPASVGVAGGDGTISAAVQVLAGGSTGLLVVPTGTRNHFAHDLGIADLDAAAAADGAGRAIAVDLGRVNDRWFVNNISVGLYPRVVRAREGRWARLPKWLGTVLAMFGELRRARSFSVHIEGEGLEPMTYRAWVVFVGNGSYGEGLLDTAGRTSLQGQSLDVAIVRADRRFAWPRVVAAFIVGRIGHSPLVERHAAPRARIEMRRPEVQVAVDGEVVRMTTPLELESVRGVLKVLVPH